MMKTPQGTVAKAFQDIDEPDDTGRGVTTSKEVTPKTLELYLNGNHFSFPQ